jgi:hypothetical protein
MAGAARGERGGGVNTHELKTWPEHFAPVLRGEKKAELRKDDRHFQVGDELILREYEPTKHAYTGRAVIAKITHILRGGEWLTPGYAMLSIRVTMGIDVPWEKIK